jgi:hypothetical protein
MLAISKSRSPDHVFAFIDRGVFPLSPFPESFKRILKISQLQSRMFFFQYRKLVGVWCWIHPPKSVLVKVSATKIVRPLESTTETQPNVQPVLLRLSAVRQPSRKFGAILGGDSLANHFAFD